MAFLTKKTPATNEIVIFGCTCNVHRESKSVSLEERGNAGKIVGTGGDTNGYKVYTPADEVVVVALHVKALKHHGIININHAIPPEMLNL